MLLMERNKCRHLAIVAFQFAVCGELFGGADIALDRYTRHSSVALPEQEDLLAVELRVDFPASIVTVGDAVTYLLHRSGYSLVVSGQPDLDALMNMSLPRVHRSIGPIRLKDALKVLIGTPWIIAENKLARTVSFELKQQFAGASSLPDRHQDGTGEISDSANSAPAPIGSRSSATSAVTEWELSPDFTLYGNLAMWANKAKWQLDWNSRHDYEISHRSTYSGTLKEAVAQTLDYYRLAPVPLVATFYDANFVLVIESERP